MPSPFLGTIPEENQQNKMIFAGVDSSGGASFYDKSANDGESESSYHTPVLRSYNRGILSSGSQSYFNTTSSNNLPFSLNSIGGTGGALNYYKRLD